MLIINSRECRTEPFDKSRHLRSSFDCGDNSINLYLKTRMSQDIRKNLTRAYVLICPPDPNVPGFYTLSNASIRTDDLPPSALHQQVPYPSIPALLLGRMGRDKNAAPSGCGSYLLIDAMLRALRLSEQVGIFTLFVDAKNPRLAAYYEHHGFLPLPTNPLKLILPIRDIAAIAMDHTHRVNRLLSEQSDTDTDTV